MHPGALDSHFALSCARNNLFCLTTTDAALKQLLHSSFSPLPDWLLSLAPRTSLRVRPQCASDVCYFGILFTMVSDKPAGSHVEGILEEPPRGLLLPLLANLQHVSLIYLLVPFPKLLPSPAPSQRGPPLLKRQRTGITPGARIKK